MLSFHTFLTNPTYSFYISLALSFLIFVTFIILKRAVTRLSKKLFSHTQNTFSEFMGDISDFITKPFDVFWLTSALYLSLLASPFVFDGTRIQPDLYLTENIQISLSIIPVLWIHNIYRVLTIGIIGWGVHNLVDLYEKAFLRIGSRFTLFDNALIIRFISKLLKALVVIITSLIIIDQFTDLTGFVASIGIFGAALTFIAQDIITDILNGIVLMIDKPFTIGDWIALNDLEGTVEDVSFRSTRIRTFEHGVVVVPNSTLSNDNITNWSSREKRRHRFTIGVTYDTSSEDLQQFLEDLKQLLGNFESIDQESSLVYFDNFGDFSLNIIIQYFTFKTDLSGFCALKESVNLAILSLANEQSINIAFPTQTIKLEQNDY